MIVMAFHYGRMMRSVAQIIGTASGKLNLRVVVAVLLGLTLSACATPPPEPAPGSVRVAPGLVLVLPKPSDLGRRLEASQLITAHYGDQTFVFEGHLSATPDRLLLLGLDPMGRKALSVTWTDAGIHAETAPWLPEQLHPENMLADIVMLYWPEESVRNALVNSGGTLAVGAHFRSITTGDKEVIRADYSGDDPWNGTLRYRNIAWGYGLEVQSVEVPQ
jgi:hypothetical protein